MKFEFEAAADTSLDPRTEVVFRLNSQEFHRIPLPGEWISDNEDGRVEWAVKVWLGSLCDLMERKEHLMKLTDGMVEHRPQW